MNTSTEQIAKKFSEGAFADPANLAEVTSYWIVRNQIVKIKRENPGND